jgi:ATP phosphoribosyltransferase regulatory subunit
MIKVIDRTGEVLVLRPDGTIPVTRLTAADRTLTEKVQRLFYIFNVYRQAGDDTRKESTQAGVEFFGNPAAEADAEVIALAAVTLQEIGFRNFKLEIGHAGLFKELIEEANLSSRAFSQLQEFIQSKNLAEMEPFVKNLGLAKDTQDALLAIPLLYGTPETVLEETRTIIQNERMQEILQHVTAVADVLKDYNVLDYITVNFGLINNMDYYTDIIFQGFVENLGKPVLMGGRYNELAAQFGKDMPAVGFAYEVDFLLEAMQQHELTEERMRQPALKVFYAETERRAAFLGAEQLRKSGYAVVTERIDTENGRAGIYYTAAQHFVRSANGKAVFHTDTELLQLLADQIGGV